MFKSQLFATLFLNLIFLGVIDGRITQPPESVTAALGTNATFTCRGNGSVFWEISGSQVLTEQLVGLFAQEKVYVPLPTPRFSQLIMTATEMNNFTRAIQCLLDPGIGVGPVEESSTVHLLVYAEPNPPSNLVIEVDSLNLVATWTEPFSLEGEEISYIVTVTDKDTGGTMVNITLLETTYIFVKPFGAHNCVEYVFTIFSRNDFSKSITAVNETGCIPDAIVIHTVTAATANPTTAVRNKINWKTTVILTVVLVVVFTLVALVISLLCYKVGIHNILSAYCRISGTQVVEAKTNAESQFVSDSVVYEVINDETIVKPDPKFIETTPSDVMYGVSTDGIETTPNEVYGVSTDGIETTPNEVYGVSTDGIETTPNVVYGVSTDVIETTPNEVYGVTDIIVTTPNEVYGLLRK